MTENAHAITANHATEQEWTLPNKGFVGMACLIVAESAIFIIFVVAYIFYLGKSITGPYPKDVLELPILGSVCLISSSVTVHMAVHFLKHAKRKAFTGWLGLTILLGAGFLATTAQEWYTLIVEKGLTIRTNLFGTTYYSLVGLHASHVIVGLIMLSVAFVLSLFGKVTEKHWLRLECLSIYWHFVDAVWIVVFLVVYVLGR